MSTQKGKAESFESALKKIEEIAHKLEKGELTLEDSVKAFEEGMRLTRLCETKLQEAQKKIQILMEKEDGKKVCVDFEAEEE